MPLTEEDTSQITIAGKKYTLIGTSEGYNSRTLRKNFKNDPLTARLPAVPSWSSVAGLLFEGSQYSGRDDEHHTGFFLSPDAVGRIPHCEILKGSELSANSLSRWVMGQPPRRIGFVNSADDPVELLNATFWTYGRAK